MKKWEITTAEGPHDALEFILAGAYKKWNLPPRHIWGLGVLYLHASESGLVDDPAGLLASYARKGVEGIEDLLGEMTESSSAILEVSAAYRNGRWVPDSLTLNLFEEDLGKEPEHK